MATAAPPPGQQHERVNVSWNNDSHFSLWHCAICYPVYRVQFGSFFFSVLFGLRFTLYRDVLLNDNDRRDYAILLQLSLGLLETCFILWRKPAPAPAESGSPCPVSSCSESREQAWCRNHRAEVSSSAMVAPSATPRHNCCQVTRLTTWFEHAEMPTGCSYRQ